MALVAATLIGRYLGSRPDELAKSTTPLSPVRVGTVPVMDRKPDHPLWTLPGFNQVVGGNSDLLVARNTVANTVMLVDAHTGSPRWSQPVPIAEATPVGANGPASCQINESATAIACLAMVNGMGKGTLLDGSSGSQLGSFGSSGIVPTLYTLGDTLVHYELADSQSHSIVGYNKDGSTAWSYQSKAPAEFSETLKQFAMVEYMDNVRVLDGVTGKDVIQFASAGDKIFDNFMFNDSGFAISSFVIPTSTFFDKTGKQTAHIQGWELLKPRLGGYVVDSSLGDRWNTPIPFVHRDTQIAAIDPRNGQQFWSSTLTPYGTNTSPIAMGDGKNCLFSLESTDTQHIATSGKFLVRNCILGTPATKEVTVDWGSNGTNWPIMAIDDGATHLMSTTSDGKTIICYDTMSGSESWRLTSQDPNGLVYIHSGGVFEATAAGLTRWL